MTNVNDPFYIGSATQHTAAQWARKLYLLLPPQSQKIHIRRLHYFALTQPQHTKPGGQVYLNTSADWKFLCNACKFARYLEILPYDAFIDRRSVPKFPTQREPIGFDSGANPSQADCIGPGFRAKTHNTAFRVLVPSPQEWKKLLSKRIETLCRTQMKLMLAKLLPAHIEFWVEKSTAADLIQPIADKYSINIITTLGELSLTAVWNFVKQISHARKPVRIFYISDFDPAGENMPISVARKIEFLFRRYRLNRKIDLKLRSLMLTRQQCKQFNLPGVPLPENKKRTFKFTRYNGRMTTELHALEVTRPGHIRRIVEDELKKYINFDRITEAAQLAEAAIQQVLEPIRVMAAGYHRLTAAVTVLEKLFATNCTDPEYDGPWLFDSERDYLTQLAAYHLHKLR